MTQLSFNIPKTYPNPVENVLPPVYKLGQILYGIPSEGNDLDDVVVVGICWNGGFTNSKNNHWLYRLKVISGYGNDYEYNKNEKTIKLYWKEGE